MCASLTIKRSTVAIKTQSICKGDLKPRPKELWIQDYCKGRSADALSISELLLMELPLLYTVLMQNCNNCSFVASFPGLPYLYLPFTIIHGRGRPALLWMLMEGINREAWEWFWMWCFTFTHFTLLCVSNSRLSFPWPFPVRPSHSPGCSGQVKMSPVFGITPPGAVPLGALTTILYECKKCTMIKWAVHSKRLYSV